MLLAETTITLDGLLSSIGSIFTALIGYVGSICETIVSNPLLLLGFAIPFAFAIVTFVRKLFH